MGMKLTAKNSGVVILILSAIGGFIFPEIAKWILAGLVTIGLISWFIKREE